MQYRMNAATEFAIAFVLLACIPAPGYFSRAAAQDQKKPVYAELVASALKGDPNVDYTAMRYASLDAPKNKKAIYHSLSEMNAPLQQKDFKKALKMANEVLENYFVDINAHLIAVNACRGLNQSDEAEKHLGFARALLKSIVDSGDGKTEDTAFVVISVDEEYVVLRQMGIFPGDQSLKHGKNGWYDVLESKKDGQDVTLYFNITKFYGKEFGL
jgi:uncharacterized UPF0160 family protein